jgi:hypothetical protein
MSGRHDPAPGYTIENLPPLDYTIDGFADGMSIIVLVYFGTIDGFGFADGCYHFRSRSWVIFQHNGSCITLPLEDVYGWMPLPTDVRATPPTFVWLQERDQ